MSSLSFPVKEFALAVLAALLILFYGFTQPPISIEDGHPYDTRSYFVMAQQVAAGESIAELRPFTYRVALPYLVGKLYPDDLDRGFLQINLLFGAMTLLLLFVYLRHYLQYNSTVLVLLLLYIANPGGPFRFTHYIAPYSDPPALFFILLLLVLADRVRQLDWRWSLLVSGLALVGILFREIAVCGVLVFVFAHSFRLQPPFPWLRLNSMRNLLLCLPPLLVALATLLLLHGSIEGTGNYQYANQMAGVVAQLAARPDIYLLAWLVAFGAVPVVLLVGANRRLGRFLRDQQQVGVFLLGSVLLSLTAGFHTDRILFWSYPAVLLLFGVFLETHPIVRAGALRRTLFFLPVVVVQILAFRAWLPIPDDPNAALSNPGLPEFVLFAPFGDATLGHIYASTMMAETRILMLSQFGLLAIYLAFLLFLESRTRGRARETDS